MLYLRKSQTVDLLDKDFVPILNVFKELKEIIFKELNNTVRFVSLQVETNKKKL